MFWLNSGPYNHLTARKFVLMCSPDALADAVQVAARNGAEFPTRPGETVDALLERLRSSFFDPDFEPIVTNKTPGPGKDILATSANNLYVGVTMDDLKGFEERYPLNSRLVKRGRTSWSRRSTGPTASTAPRSAGSSATCRPRRRSPPSRAARRSRP